MMTDIPKEPAGLRSSGRALWRDVQTKYELEQHETQLLIEMCRAADQLDTLAAIVARDGVQHPISGRINPAAVEARQLKIAYARLSAALRLPSGDEERRPQRRVGMRGVYGPRAVS